FYTPFLSPPVTFSLLPLSPSRDLGSCDPSPSKGRPGHHRPIGTYGSAFVSPSQPDRSQPRGPLSWPENHVFRGGSCKATRTSSSKFSFVSPPNRSSKASEVQPISMRKLQRVKLAWTICREGRGIHHRANHSFRAKGNSAEFSAEV
ncbi:hypothetical protein Prudu_017844, partial [Prunus dulcis]